MVPALEAFQETHFASNTKFESPSLVERSAARASKPNSLLGDVGLNDGASVVELVNQLDLMTARLPSFGSRDHRDAWEGVKSDYLDLRRKLDYRLAHLNLLAWTPVAGRSQNPNLAQILKEQAEINKIIDHIHILLSKEPEDTAYAMAALLREIGAKYGHEGTPASPIEFIDYVVDQIDHFAEEVDLGKFSVLDIPFMITPENSLSLLDLYLYFRDQVGRKEFARYGAEFGKIWGSIWAYVSWRVTSRKYQAIYFEGDNYVVGESLKQQYSEVKPIVSDATIYDVIRNIPKLKDGHDSSAPERARAGLSMYEGMMAIDLICSQDEKTFLSDAQLATLNTLTAADQQLIAQGVPQAQVMSEKKRAALTSERARWLRVQPGLEWLTKDEAEFIVTNYKRFIPWERSNRDNLQSTRKMIQLIIASGPIRNDRYRTTTEKEWSSIISSKLKIEVKNGNTVIYYRGIELSAIKNLPPNNPLRQEIESIQLERKIKKMLAAGVRFEGGAFSMFWATFQGAQADADYVWGFNKTASGLAHAELYTLRYGRSDYVYPWHTFEMAVAIPRMMLSWTAQAEVRRTPNSPVESLRSVVADQNLNFETDFQPESMLWMGEAHRLPDNLGRAIETKEMVSKGFFDYIKVPLDSFNASKAGVEWEKIYDGIRKMYKVFKYQAEMFIWSEDISMLVTNKALVTILKPQITQLNQLEASGNKAEASKLRTIIMRSIVENLVKEFLHEGLVHYFRQRHEMMEPDQKISRDKIKSNSALKDDLRFLVSVLTDPATVRRSVLMDPLTDKPLYDGNGKPMGKAFLNSKFNGKDVWDSTDVVSQIIRKALDHAYAYSNIHIPDKEQTAFGRYIKKP